MNLLEETLEEFKNINKKEVIAFLQENMSLEETVTGISQLDRLLSELNSIKTKIKTLSEREEELILEIEMYLEEIKNNL